MDKIKKWSPETLDFTGFADLKKQIEFLFYRRSNMGMKYMINAFNYPYQGYEKCKQTKFFIIAVFWFSVLSIKYDGVDIQKRK